MSIVAGSRELVDPPPARGDLWPNTASLGTFLSTMPCRAREYPGVKVLRAGVRDLDFITAAKMHR
jgi:hypothetical protein